MLPAIKHARSRLRYFRSISNKGYHQADVVILPKHLADDFEAFCHSNSAPLPLLYRSQSGDSSFPPLAKDADIRTDVSQYRVYQDGVLVTNVSSLQKDGASVRSTATQPVGHRVKWSDMVCFHLGSSFGFEDILKKAGVGVGKSVGMYKTAVPCIRAGVFRSPLVVSMYPIPPDMLEAAVQVSHRIPQAHGAPVHIGDTAFLGIQDLSRPDYGDRVELQPSDVPVFWASGATAVEAIISSKPTLAFSRSPGMFLTDAPLPTDNKEPEAISPPPELTPTCFLISKNPLLYSLVSKRVASKIGKLDAIIGEDPGQRGIKALFVQDELLRSCLALSHASSVAITTGFPTHYMHSPPDETDGPPGAFAIATMLQSLGKRVTMVTDRRALEMNGALIDKAVKSGVLKTTIPLVTFEDSGPNAALDFLCHHGDPAKPRYDHLVAIERSGRAADGNYYNMRAINIKHLVDPIDDLFLAAEKIPGITTTGIGDGGNELGMGKVKEKVKSLMPKGDLIACDVAADYAITAGVSNWGGYAVACGLYLLNTCPTHQRYLNKGLGVDHVTPKDLQDWTANLPSVNKEESILSTLVDFGIRSGKTGHLAMEVDGLTFHPSHSDIITRLLEVTLGSAK
uniref:D-glutamate cyclase, mitochondrial-like isoform X1 n=2 Tax=Doryrhamphus excisus TaxID=161450 RepID=UPI0025ADB5DC|nr:D-glutamate cyclase, mitochondrial-like isoform X1 [Doryrhamphus excisus]